MESFKVNLQNLSFKTTVNNREATLGFADLFANKRVVLFSLPVLLNSFSWEHTMDFENSYREFVDLGIDAIYCTNSNPDSRMLAGHAARFTDQILALPDLDCQLLTLIKDQFNVNKDIKNFGASNEVHIDVPAKMICDYYITKKCSYINVGSHGFFTLNGQDKLKLNEQLKKNNLQEIPDFGKSASAKIRVRCQYKGGGDYQFVMTLQFSSVKKSPYNIAPLQAGSSSKIAPRHSAFDRYFRQSGGCSDRNIQKNRFHAGG